MMVEMVKVNGAGRLIITAAALGTAGAAPAADVVLAPAPPGPQVVAPADDADATAELKWDTGRPKWLVAWHTGAGTWVGNDFSVATLKTYGGIKQLRFYTGPAWPNNRWDGFRLGIYAFSGNQPGALLKGPLWVKGTSQGYAWNDFALNWVLPAGTRSFVAACEQLYNYPNCDAFTLDDNPTFRGHSWIYYDGAWSKMSTAANPYKNLMLRVIVDNEQNAPVGPSSYGRVKALFR